MLCQSSALRHTRQPSARRRALSADPKAPLPSSPSSSYSRSSRLHLKAGERHMNGGGGWQPDASDRLSLLWPTHTASCHLACTASSNLAAHLLGVSPLKEPSDAASVLLALLPALPYAGRSATAAWVLLRRCQLRSPGSGTSA